jgi:phosphomethylpyrimidine synthase
MKITQDLREEAAAMAEREKGMVEKSAEFLEKGGRLYV